MARRWAPRQDRFPEIVIDLRVAYGQPVGPSGIPTATIMDTYAAEGENLDEVALWFGVPVAEAARAVNFEKFLNCRLQANAAWESSGRSSHCDIPAALAPMLNASFGNRGFEFVHVSSIVRREQH